MYRYRIAKQLGNPNAFYALIIALISSFVSVRKQY
jgi:hypothetical protein